MKISAIVITVCLYVVPCTSNHAQDNQQPMLSANPNDVGSLQNSINLFTGQAGFPMTLASLPGRGGLNPQLTILYNSAGVKQQVGTWNRDAPTGTVGLGWYLDFTHIVADHQNTGTRHDDTFYLSESGSLNKLVCTDADQHTPKKNYRTYVLETHQPWIILYYYNDEKWVITKDNGYKSVFGDNKRSKADGTVQYMVRWGNWMGDSNVQAGQLPLAYAWNLSTVENLWGDKLTYYYTNIEERVGASTGKYHTRASALRKIVGPTGNSIELKYQDKLCEQCSAPYAFRNPAVKREYQDPHVEAAEPDAYQEKYESRYLSSVATYDEKKALLYTIKLDYDFIYGKEGVGEFYKRLLTKIQKTNANGEQVPATVFGYHREGDARGYLSHVDNSIGGVISYNYQLKSNILGGFVYSNGKYTIPGVSLKPVNGLSKRDLTIKPPAPTAGKSIGFADLQVGSDYVVVIWRELNDAGNIYDAQGYLYIYQWEGEWVEYNMGRIGAYDVSDDLNRFKALFTLQPDFFAFVKRSENSDGSFGDCNRKDLFVFRKSKTGWEKFKFENIDLPYYFFHKKCDEGYWASETFLFSGNRYIALGSRASRGFTTYTWNGSMWVMEDHETSFTAIDNALSGENNYIIYHNNDENPNGKDLTTIWYLTEDLEWVRNVFPTNFRFASGKAKRDADGTDRSFWYNAPALSLCMADDNPEYAYQWDDNYNITKRIELFTTYKESDPVFLNDKGRVLCNVGYIGAFNGSNFVTNPFGRNHHTNKTFFTPQGIVYGGKFFLPDFPWFVHTEFDPNTNTWTKNEGQTPVFAGLSSAVLLGGAILYREPDGSWLNIAEFPTEGRSGSDVNTVGPNVFTESIPLDLSTSDIPGSTVIHYLKNGRDQAYTIPYLMDDVVHIWEDGWKDKHFGGYNIYVAFDRTNPTKERSKALYLFRLSDDQITGGHESLVVSSITVNDGYLDFKKSFSYNTASAVMSANGAYPTFNQVDVINGSLDPAKRPHGFTRHYYYNRKDLKSGKYTNVPEAQDETFGGQIVGTPYLTEVYDDVGTKLQSSTTFYSRYENNIFRNTASGPVWIGISSFLRPVKTISTAYYPDHSTFTTAAITVYDAQTGLVSSTKQYNGEATWMGSETIYAYYKDVYPAPPNESPATAKNILSEIVGTVNRVDGNTISSTATLWQTTGVPQPTRSYVWRGSGDESFTHYDGTDPGPDWRLTNKVTLRDAVGNILESFNFKNTPEAAAYDDLKRNPILNASHAAYDQVAYTGFEPGQNKGWTFDPAALNAAASRVFTGSKSLKGKPATSATLPVGTYELYFWYRDGAVTTSTSGGSVVSETDVLQRLGWTQRKVVVNLATPGTIQVAPAGYLDELRLHPPGAYMTTIAYNSKEQKVAETGPSMITTYYYYDRLDRQHYITDDNKNIVKHYLYGFKKSPTD